MSKKGDPAVRVLAYFESAELPLARQALALAQAIVKRRTPRAVTTTKSRSKAKPQDTPAVIAN